MNIKTLVELESLSGRSLSVNSVIIQVEVIAPDSDGCIPLSQAADFEALKRQMNDMAGFTMCVPVTVGDNCSHWSFVLASVSSIDNVGANVLLASSLIIDCPAILSFKVVFGYQKSKRKK